MTHHNTTCRTRRTRRTRVAGLAALAAALPLAITGCGSSGAGAGGAAKGGKTGAVSMEHYFSDTFGSTAFKKIVPTCEKQTGEKINNAPTDQEAFKQQILVQLSGGNPPDLFSYWAGAKTQYLVDQKSLSPLDDVWAKDKIDDSIPTSMSDSASVYHGHKYLLPFDYHYVGMFYNVEVMKKAGITTMPKTWDDLMSDAAKLKSDGITPFALGSKDRWPAQFWFDYLLLRTAGSDYRQKLMAGEAKYTDPEVKTAFTMYKTLFDKGYFNASPNGLDENQAQDLVANGKAAMTLDGTWTTGYWDSHNFPAVTGYNMFPFPEVTAGVPQAALGPIDGWALSAAAAHKDGAEKLLGCLAGPQAQKAMALAEGALAPNKNADLSSQNQVMQNAAKLVQQASTFVFNYDLATTPDMSDPGLDAIQQFVDDPSTLDSDLEQMQSTADGVFSK